MASGAGAPNNPDPRSFLPDIPLTESVPLQNLLQAIKERVEQIWIAPNPPSGITGLTITKNNLGNLISWNQTANAASYRVFRNTSADFTTALQIDELQGPGNVSTFDAIDQLNTVATRFYWVRGVNAGGIEGPLSAINSATNFATTATGTAVGVDAVAGGASGTAVGRNAATGVGANNTAIGVSASTLSGSTANNVAVGAAITVTGGSGVGVGAAASITGLRGTGVGHTVSVTATDATAVGDSAGANGTNDVAIGAVATSGVGGSNTVIGKSATTVSGSTTLNVAIATSCLSLRYSALQGR